VRVSNVRPRGTLRAQRRAFDARQPELRHLQRHQRFPEERLLEPSRRASARHVHFAFYPRTALAGGGGRGLRRRGVTTSWDFGWNEGLLSDPGSSRCCARSTTFRSTRASACSTRGKAEWPRRAVLAGLLPKLLVNWAPGCKWITPAGRLRAPAAALRVDTTAR